MNLSAPFLIQFFKDQMMSVLPYADIVFGNETEAATFAEVHNLDTKDVRAIAAHIAALPKENSARPRTVVITQGAEPVICVTGTDHQVQEFPVHQLTADKIVDTNGAGDAFVGGFLAQYVQGASLEVSVKCGIWAATHIIQRSGCTHPELMDFTA
jgi:adenosine kinase